MEIAMFTVCNLCGQEEETNTFIHVYGRVHVETLCILNETWISYAVRAYIQNPWYLLMFLKQISYWKNV